MEAKDLNGTESPSGSVGLCRFTIRSVRTVWSRLLFSTNATYLSAPCAPQVHVIVSKSFDKTYSTFHQWSHGCILHRIRHTHAHSFTTMAVLQHVLRPAEPRGLVLHKDQKMILSTFGKSNSRTLQANMTVAECKTAAEQTFIQSSTSEPTESASYLIAHVLGHKTLSGIPLNRTMAQDEIDFLRHLIDLRLTSLPVQYVIGEWDFRSLTLDMNPPVLIPRPETEELVDHILTQESFTSGGRFLEVGPGSGAICCSILVEHPEMTCVAVDISVDACNLTKRNAEKNGVIDQLEIFNTPVNKYADISSSRTFDFIVSNPPYIKSEDMKALQSEIKGFEDPTALHGGDDGLDVIHDILKLAPQVLNPGGSLWLEVDSTHPPLIQEIALQQQSKLTYITTISDFNLLPRFCHLKVKDGKT